MNRIRLLCVLPAVLLLVATADVAAQGVTTAAISGLVTDGSGAPLAGARVVAVHVPSGTRYGAVTRADGRASLPGMRVGGPYTVTVTLIGYESQSQAQVFLNLGITTDLAFVMREAGVQLEAVTVEAEAGGILSSHRTGAATSVNRATIAALPSITGRIEDFTRLTPQYSSAGFGFSFAGQDNRLNNTTVDGSYFNNSFGLAGQPGDRTGVAPISLDAIEQLQVNIAPYDVRQGGFVGAGVNTVTRSGTNRWVGSLYYQYRHEGLVGTKAAGLAFDPGEFRYSRLGVNLGGPVLANRLFFFASYEDDGLTQPGTTFRANLGTEPVGGSVTRVRVSTMDSLSTYLATNFGYETDVYQGYDHETPAKRFLGRLDFNLSDRNKLSVRYIHLDSNTDVLLSNSSSLGFGTRRTNTNGLNFRNSNYIILENIRSLVGEWNSILSDNLSNNLIVGYTHHDESRDSRGEFFPMVDILEGGSVYTTFGFEPFTPNNELRYSSFQLQDNLTLYRRNHTVTFGVSAERYESENVFFPGSQSAYVYNDLDHFYLDANDFIAQCGTDPAGWPTCSRASTPIDPATGQPLQLRRFQVRWNNIPGQEKPIQPLEVFFGGVYGQDEWQATSRIRVTAGLRLDVPVFGETGYANAAADTLTFRDENGNAVRYDTGKLPDANILWSPRVGFNWNAVGDRRTQVRGGTGIFTGRPAYVWISNQIGNTGVLTGFARLDDSPTTPLTNRPFHPDPDHYKPTNVTGEPASSYELALTDPNFKFPQLWRTNLAVDQALPLGLIGTAEILYNRDVNGIYYINANLPAPQSAFVGPDDRPRWTSNRINTGSGNFVQNAIVLKNQNVGRSWNVALSLERPFSRGIYAKVAYSYGEAKNTVDPGSIAFGSWNNNQHPGDPNNPGLGFATTSPGHRVFAALSYTRSYFNLGATTVSLFWEGRNGGNASYTFSGDLNGDGGTSNDLIYIPRNTGEMNFQPYTSGSTTFTAQQQADAWEAYIQQDSYLRGRRGGYAERGGVFLPMVYRADVSIVQDLFKNVAGWRQGVQLRLDILNFGNLLNDDWGVGKRFVNTQPLIVPTTAQGGPADAQGRAQYRLRNIGGQLMTKSFETNTGFGDVWRIQLSVRYNFN